MVSLACHCIRIDQGVGDTMVQSTLERASRSCQYTFMKGIMIRHLLAVALLAIGATLSEAQPSLPSGFQARTIHSPEGADIFVRSRGHGSGVLCIQGNAENSGSCAPLAEDLMRG